MQDYSNPITRFSMRDYPHDDGARMSQVHNGEKLLLDMPSDVGAMSIRANDRLFFNGELLQRKSGAYFIPEHFFTRPRRDRSNHNHLPADEELYALGCDVTRSEVRPSALFHVYLLMS
jgi:hypothetical protein